MGKHRRHASDHVDDVRDDDESSGQSAELRRAYFEELSFPLATDHVALLATFAADRPKNPLDAMRLASLHRVSVRSNVARAEHRIRLLNEARDAALLVALGFTTIVVVVMGVVLAWAGMADLPLEPTLKLTIDFVVSLAIGAAGAVLLWCASRLARWLVVPQPVLT